MSQQRPPSGAGGGRHDGGRLAQRRCNEAWRSMDRVSILDTQLTV